MTGRRSLFLLPKRRRQQNDWSQLRGLLTFALKLPKQVTFRLFAYTGIRGELKSKSSLKASNCIFSRWTNLVVVFPSSSSKRVIRWRWMRSSLRSEEFDP